MMPTYTTNSTPAATEPTRRQLITCPHCGGARLDYDGPHSPHWRDGVRVDCRGLEVMP